MVIRVNPAKPKGIVWLASYPRSGNTWARAFLYALYHAISGDSRKEIDVNRMNDFTTDDRMAEFYGKYVSGPVESADPAEIAAARPRVQADIAAAANGTALVKTHNAMAYDHGHPMINLDVSAGAIYVIRNPLDVAISFSHFRGESLDQVIGDMATQGFGAPTDARLVSFTLGTWTEHVASWTARPNPVLHVVRYEDLLAKPADAFGAIARHVLMQPTAAQLEQAIEVTAFDRLHKAETLTGFREKPDTADRFFRDGRADQWRDVLSPDQVKRIVADHGEQMGRFGYLPD